jgi:hypothetical protein
MLENAVAAANCCKRVLSTVYDCCKRAVCLCV